MKKRSRTRIKRRQRDDEVNLNKSMQMLARDHYKKINHFFSKKKRGTSEPRINSSLLAVERFKRNMEQAKAPLGMDKGEEEAVAKTAKKTFFLGNNFRKKQPMFFSILEQDAADRKQILPTIKKQDTSRFTKMDFFKTMRRVEAKRIRTKRRRRRKDLEKKHQTFSNFFRSENSLKRNKNETGDRFFWYKVPEHLVFNNKNFNDYYHSDIAEELRKNQVNSYNQKLSLESESSSMKSFLINILGSQRSRSKMGSGSFLNMKSTYGKSMKSSMREKDSLKEEIFSNGSSFVIDELSQEDDIEQINVKRRRSSIQTLQDARKKHDQWRRLKKRQNQVIKKQQSTKNLT